LVSRFKLLSSCTLGLLITARQYGEVVLPDASTGQSLGTLARNLSRCKEGMAHFLPSWYKFYRALRVSRYKYDRSREFIPVYKVGGGHWRSLVPANVVSRESRYNLSRSQKFIKVQEFNCGQMSVSGCNDHYEFVLGAEAKAKSVTNNLPILSVLGLVYILWKCYPFKLECPSKEPIPGPSIKM
jgi:hypothetical protein